MFEYLEPYRKIIVTGMPRSGTTICARMIQYDLEIYKTLWAGDYKDLVDKLFTRLDEPGEGFNARVVLHAPSLSYCVHEFEDYNDVAIVWMKRDYADTFASIIRTQWDPRDNLKAYHLESAKDIVKDIRALDNAKSEKWKIQKPAIKNWFEIEYESLRSHRMWFDDKEARKSWPSRITSPNSKDPLDGSHTYGKLRWLLEEFPKDE